MDSKAKSCGDLDNLCSTCCTVCKVCAKHDTVCNCDKPILSNCDKRKVGDTNNWNVDISGSTPCKLNCGVFTKTDPNVTNNLHFLNDDYNELFRNSNYYTVNQIVDYFNVAKSNSVIVMHFNVRSLSKNIDKLCEYISLMKCRPDVILITETKLKKNITSYNINLNGYNFIHRDSITNAGGVGIYIKNSIVFNTKEFSFNLHGVEDLWIETTINKKLYIIGVIYRHPTYESDNIDAFSKAMNDALHTFNLKKSNFCVLGDFNLNLFDIEKINNIRKYANSLISCSVKCIVNKATRISDSSKTLIDHVYVNNEQKKTLGGVALMDISDHLPTFAVIPNCKPITKLSTQVFREMKNFHTELYLRDLQEKYLYFNPNQSNIHDAFLKFITVFNETVDLHAPLKKCSRKDKKLKEKPWITKAILISIKKKNQLFSNLHKKFTESKFQYFKTYRNNLNRIIKSAKQNFYKKCFSNAAKDSKTLWKTVNELVNLKHKKVVSPNRCENDDGTILNEPTAISEAFNDHFSSIGKKMADNIPKVHKEDSNATPPRNVKNSIFFAPVTVTEICNHIDLLKDKKAFRKLDVDTKFLKISKYVVSPILCMLFNRCFLEGVFPDCLKIAEVIPIYKRGNVNRPTNYRPISLLSHFDKIFEKLIHQRIMSYLDKFSLLTEHQFGFRQNSSTNHAITYIYDNLIQNVDQGLFSCCLFLDLSKAFDTIDHDILVWKLYHYFGFRGKAYDLIASFLNNRYQYTNVDNTLSSLKKITCGIPQGSCLGPLLFLMYINDLPLASRFNITLFADDTYLSLSDKCLHTLEDKINLELQRIDIWLRKNKLSLNYEKTNFMLIHKQPKKVVQDDFKVFINQNEIQRSATVKYLGLNFDEKLDWSTHIKNLSSQLARTSALFYKLRNLTTQETMRLLYYSLIHSKVQYGIVAWGTANKTFLREIQIRLNYVLKIITSNSIFVPLSPIYKKLNILKLHDIYKLELGKFMHSVYYKRAPKIFNKFFKHLNEHHNYQTRQVDTSTYFLPRVNKQFAQNQISYRGTKLWATIPATIKNKGFHSFKQLFRNSMLSSY